jgi:hypothetical protein
MIEFRITLRCATQPEKHAKIIRMEGLARDWVEAFAHILDGTSPMYIHKPGPDSPIGKCATCGGQLTSSIEEREIEDGDAKHNQPVG